MRRIVASSFLLLLACWSGWACDQPLQAEPEEVYWVAEVYHVLNHEGRRVGEMTADSMVVSEQGTLWRAWTVSVRLDRGDVTVRADSMTLDWRSHEMRYHGIVELTTEGRSISAEDVLVSEW